MKTKLISISEIIDITTLSKASIYRLIKQKKFPAGYYITPKRRVWKKEEVELAIEQMLTGSADQCCLSDQPAVQLFLIKNRKCINDPVVEIEG